MIFLNTSNLVVESMKYMKTIAVQTITIEKYCRPQTTSSIIHP